MAGITKSTSFSITVKSAMPTDKSFSECTNAEIVQLAQALQAGTITADQLNWGVGDARNVSLGSFKTYSSSTSSTATQAAQTAQLVILHKNANGICAGKQFTDNTVPSFIIGFKDNVCKSYWNSSASNVYQNSLCYKVEDNIYNALPDDLKPAFKQFKAITGIYSSSSQTSHNRYMCSPAARELFGGNATSAGSGTGYSLKAEYDALGSNAQFTYYATQTNRVHSNIVAQWWERSPRYSRDDLACYVNPGGTANYGGVNDSVYGLAPFGCI